MKRLSIAALVLAFAVPIGIAGQDAAAPLVAFTRTLPGDGLELSLVHMNNSTVPILFQPPTLYSIRARAAETTLLYVQGTAEMDVKLDTTSFTIEQAGESLTGTPINIKHFEKGTVSVPGGERVDGLLAFERQVDLAAPFTVRHGDSAVEFSLDEEALEQLAAAAPQ